MGRVRFFLKRIATMNRDGARLCATGFTAISKHRLEHQPQLVDCTSQVTILLAASTRALENH